jgi:hypothetical protein
MGEWEEAGPKRELFSAVEVNGRVGVIKVP